MSHDSSCVMSTMHLPPVCVHYYRRECLLIVCDLARLAARPARLALKT